LRKEIPCSTSPSIELDGAAALTGHMKGFQDEGNNYASRKLCRLHHRDALAQRDLQPQLHRVLQNLACWASIIFIVVPCIFKVYIIVPTYAHIIY
jgi:hypothetical protein